MKSIRWVVLVWTLAFLVVVGMNAQGIAFPGKINLLPGYELRTEQGIDSAVGTISKTGGLKMDYDIGELAGDYTECSACGWTDGQKWRKEQIISGRKVVCVFAAKNLFVVTFVGAHANFYATIESEDQLADMLLMALSFEPALPKSYH
jgi:hypothetical protein